MLFYFAFVQDIDQLLKQKLILIAQVFADGADKQVLQISDVLFSAKVSISTNQELVTLAGRVV